MVKPPDSARAFAISLIVQEFFRIQHRPQDIFDCLMSIQAGGVEGLFHQSSFVRGGKAGERAKVDIIGNFVGRS